MSRLEDLMLRCREESHSPTYADLLAVLADVESLRAQLAARVPDALPPYEHPQGADYGESREEGYINGWNACRAAMLSAAPSQQAPAQGEPVLRHRVRVHLANRYSYSHKDFCEKLEEIMNEDCRQEVVRCEPFGYVYSWVHSSALGRPDETYTGFAKSLEDAKRHPAHFDIQAVFTHLQQASKPMTEEQIRNGNTEWEPASFYYGARFAERFHKIGEK